MKIPITLRETEYKVYVEPSHYTAVRLGETKDGRAKETEIEHFVSMSSAVKKITQSHLSELDEVITLKEYAERVEAAYKKLMDQVDL